MRKRVLCVIIRCAINERKEVIEVFVYMSDVFGVVDVCVVFKLI